MLETCGGAAVMGSVQQPIWVKGTKLFQKGFSTNQYLQQIRLNSIKPCKVSNIEGSLVSARPPSSVSVPAPDAGGN